MAGSAPPTALSSAPVPAVVREFLAAHHTMTLATCTDARPWAAAVFYACDERCALYFVSDPGTRHAREAHHNPQVAAAIHGHDQEWRHLQGIQMEGRLEVVSAERRAAAEDLYLKRFPELARLLESPVDEQESRVRERFAAATFYVFEPRLLRFIDNTRGFASRQEWTL